MDSRRVYAEFPELYDELVRHEDCDGHLLEALQAIALLRDRDVVELGAGTGRVTRLLAPHVRTLAGFDSSAPMLELARKHIARLSLPAASCMLALADNANLPLPAACADLAIAGWSYGHQTIWNERDWRVPIEAALGEMLRVLRPGGTAIVIETLGTGFSEPFRAPGALGEYYALLEGDWQFSRRWIRTDYAFPSLAVGQRLVDFFFGAEAGRSFAQRGLTRLPECTGLWSRRT